MQYDSAAAIKANEYLFNFGMLEAIKIFRQRPIPMITFYLNYLADGLNPYYFRVVNALFMACAAGAAVLALMYLLEISGINVSGNRSRIRTVSICLGLAFVLHPVTTYLVVYVWQRMALLSALFFFVALAAYLATRIGRMRNTTLGYAICVAMFFLAMASKESAITLPAILLLVEFTFFDESLRDLLKRSAIFGCVALIAILALSFLERPHGQIASQAGLLATIGRYYKEGGVTLAQVAMGQCVVFFEYLKMAFLPMPSNVHLINPQIVPTSIIDPPATAAAVAGVAVIVVSSIYLLKRRPLIGFGTLFFIINLLPEAFLVPQYLFFGYRIFVSMFGLLLIVADGILCLLDLVKGEKGKLLVKVGLSCAFAVTILLSAHTTVTKDALWMSQIAFWNDVRNRLPNDRRVEKHVKIQTLDNLGNYLRTSGRTDRALALHQEALRTDKGFGYTYLALAWDYAQSGRLDDAAGAYKELLRMDKNNAAAHAGLADVLLKQNRLDKALQYFKEALKLKPRNPDYIYGIATVWLEKKDTVAALPYLQRTIVSNPGHVEAQYDIGKILMDAGMISEAIDHFNAALAANPKFWMAHNNLGVILARMGRLPEAIDHFYKALKINPGDEPTRKNLETALASLRATGRTEGGMRKGSGQ